MTRPASVADIRKTFLDFFASKGHTVVASSPLVPGNDPTLMFTNSGMVQFKDVFLGTDKRNYVRAASVQACLRAGGKHNDLENVGYTARHHTFFEMLGNWSFGDYFKRESLKWAWELLTEVYKLPKEKLLATVYEDDDEAYDIWTKEIGLPPERVIRIGDNKGGRYKSDNFWMMADTGPCGPCSEIFYDHGDHIPGGPPGSPDEDGDRFIEIWNNVFMQFNMADDGSITPLPAPCVDTGMGLERLAAILQHVHSNYEIDLFDALIKAAARETGCADLGNNSLKVIADHIRATAFLVSDGVLPGNEGRGYVQRRIIRRAIRHGYKLGQKTPFFHKLVPDLVAVMGDAYPSLAAQADRIMDVLRVEEERFYETLEVGMQILDEALAAYARALALRPGHLDATLNRIDALVADGQAAAALDAVRAVLAQHPGHPRAANQLGALLEATGDLDGAVAAYQAGLDAGGLSHPVGVNLARTLVQAGRPRDAVAVADRLLAALPSVTTPLAMKCAALARAGEEDALADLMGLDRFVKVIDHAQVEGFATREAFDAALAQELAAHPSLTFEPEGLVTRGGRQSDDLANATTPALAALAGLARHAIASYLQDLPQGDHPFLKARPGHWSLTLWGTILSPGGEVGAHIHAPNWLSGVYYPALPDMVSTGQQGWLAMGALPDTLGGGGLVRRYEPRAGRMILFPSYLWHGTLPFSGTRPRLSLAFDCVPAGTGRPHRLAK